MRSACVGEAFFKESEGKRYCVLHYPGAEKAESFNQALARKVQARDFDFSGVWFPELSFSGKIPVEASFKESEFSSQVVFSQTNFDEGVSFNQAKFAGPVDFSQATFAGPVNFDLASFARPVNFSQATFAGPVNVGQANFAEEVVFSQANFTGMVLLSRTSFRKSVDFSQAKFSGLVLFTHTSFGDFADFRSAQFADANFQYAKFVMADFTEAKFTLANFIEAEFKQAHFVNAEFRNDALFNPIRVSEQTNFRNARFFAKASFGDAALEAASFDEATFANLVDFGEAKFANSSFEKTQFSDRVNFGDAKFRSNVVFKNARFKDADFLKAQFSGPADFRNTSFTDDANFEETLFAKDVLFRESEFNKNATFYMTRFVPDDSSNQRSESQSPPTETANKVSFDSARFKDTFVFEGCELDRARLSFASATAENPSRVSFRSVNLRPIWFIRFDSQDLQFEKVRWQKLTRGKIISAEIGTLQQENIRTPYESLEIVCRQLAANAEENNRYEEAARLRFVANEAHRRESWHKLVEKPGFLESWKNLNPMLWLYGAVSGYGERAWQAAGVLIAIWFLFALVFYVGQNDGLWWRLPQTSNPNDVQTKEIPKSDGINADQIKETTKAGDQRPILRDFREALLYSANVVALQKPEPSPANRRAKFLVLTETLLGPLQLALLALAIRRKFMR